MSGFMTGETVSAAVTEVFSRLDACLDQPREALGHRPGYPDAWSVLEHLEHVSLANHFLLLTIGKGCRKAIGRAAFTDPPEGESDLDLLEAMAVPGGFEWTPPAHMVPTGKVGVEEIRKLFRIQRERCLALLAAMPRGEGRLCTIYLSVNRAGRLDMYQWLYFLVQHARYHLRMIRDWMP